MIKVLRVTGEYRDRQEAANKAGVDLYLEQHINSSTSDTPDYALGVVATNASERSKEVAMWYAAEAGARFDVGGPDDHDVGYGDGVRVGGRGNGNLYYTNMPAVILEPWFASNPTQAKKMNTPSGIREAAELLAETVKMFVPENGSVALSVGHAGKPSRPNDLGAAIVGGGTEAGWSQKVVALAERLIVKGDEKPGKAMYLNIRVDGVPVRSLTLEPGLTVELEVAEA